MTKPKKDVKFQHRDARRPSRAGFDEKEKDGSIEATSPTRNGHTKPEMNRNESYAWQTDNDDDDKASMSPQQ